jgi:putative tricarboxylic transport membrane protein
VVAAEGVQARDLSEARRKMAEQDIAQQETEGGARLQAESAPPAEGPTSVLVAAGLLILSAYFAVGGWELPQPEGWQTAPGMLPVLLGGSLFVMSAVLLVKAIRAGALHVSLSEEFGDSSLTRVALAFLFIGVFYFGLLAFVPFEPAAAIFLFAMLWLFWPEGKLLIRAIIAIALPICITLCFAAGFGLPLPGQGNLVLAVQYLMVAR